MNEPTRLHYNVEARMPSHQLFTQARVMFKVCSITVVTFCSHHDYMTIDIFFKLFRVDGNANMIAGT